MKLGNGVISELSRGRAGNKNRPHDRWLFVSGSGKPEGHFLRKLKTHALRAGLNCGRCKSTETKGGYDHEREVEVTCKTDDICGKWKLHRFRKTRATRWMEAGIPIRNIQKWLGHRSLETTMVYASWELKMCGKRSMPLSSDC